MKQIETPMKITQIKKNAAFCVKWSVFSFNDGAQREKKITVQATDPRNTAYWVAFNIKGGSFLLKRYETRVN